MNRSQISGPRYPTDPDAFTRIQRESRRSPFPDGVGVPGDATYHLSHNFNFGNDDVTFRFYPYCRQRPTGPQVVFYHARNDDTRRFEWVIGAGRLDEFIAHYHPGGLRYPTDPNSWTADAELAPLVQPDLPQDTGHAVDDAYCIYVSLTNLDDLFDAADSYYKIAPHIRMRETPHVVYYEAILVFDNANTQNTLYRNDFIIGPAFLDHFVSNIYYFAGIANQFFPMTPGAELSPYELEAARAMRRFMSGDIEGYWHHLGQSWKEALNDPGWWLTAGMSTAAPIAARGAAPASRMAPKQPPTFRPKLQGKGRRIKMSPRGPKGSSGSPPRTKSKPAPQQQKQGQKGTPKKETTKPSDSSKSQSKKPAKQSEAKPATTDQKTKAQTSQKQSEQTGIKSKKGGGKTGRKLSKDKIQNQRKKVEELEKERDVLRSKRNKTPQDKKDLKKAEKALKKAREELKKSEEHARQSQKPSRRN